VHFRDAMAMALDTFQVMGCQEQRSAVVDQQIDEMFPNSVACNGGQSDGRLIEKQHAWPM
jgi:hypothetical protein